MAAAHSTHAFKKAASAAVKEFCDSEDYDEVARILSVRAPENPPLSRVHSPRNIQEPLYTGQLCAGKDYRDGAVAPFE